MKKTACILLISLFILPLSHSGNTLFSHENQVVKPKDDIKKMFEKGLYTEIVEEYGNTPRTSSAEELSYVAESI